MFVPQTPIGNTLCTEKYKRGIVQIIIFAENYNNMHNVPLKYLSQRNKDIVCELYKKSFDHLDTKLSFAVIDESDKMLGFVLIGVEDAPIEILCNGVGCKIEMLYGNNQHNRLLTIKRAIDRIEQWVLDIDLFFDYFFVETNNDDKKTESIEFDGEIYEFLLNKYEKRHIIYHKIKR